VWASGPVWTGTEDLTPTGIRSPDRPARRQSLYRLRYPATTALSEGIFFHCVRLRPTISAHPNGKLILICFLDCKADSEFYLFRHSSILPFDCCMQVSVDNDTGESLLICSVYLTKLAPILTAICLPFDLIRGIPLTRYYRRSESVTISKYEMSKQRWYRSGNFEMCCWKVRLPAQLLFSPSLQRLYAFKTHYIAKRKVQGYLA
jgi:hypothetical protein